MRRIGDIAFEWDEQKRLSNIEKHGIDFADAAEIFDGRVIVTRQSHFPAEPRWLTIGQRDVDVVTVVWTPRGDNVRIISTRRARKNEIALLDQARLHRGGP